MTTLLLFAAIAVGTLFLSVLFLWLGARWVKAARPTFLRALAAGVVIWLMSIVVNILGAGIFGVNVHAGRFAPSQLSPTRKRGRASIPRLRVGLRQFKTALAPT